MTSYEKSAEGKTKFMENEACVIKQFLLLNYIIIKNL